MLSHAMIPSTTDSTTGPEEKMIHNNINNSSIGHDVGYGRSSSTLGGGANNYSRHSEKDSDVYGQSVDFNATSKSNSHASSTQNSTGSNSSSNSSSSSSSSSSRSGGRNGISTSDGLEYGVSGSTAFDYWIKTFETGRLAEG